MSRNLEAQYIRDAGRRRVEAAALQDVGPINAGGGYLDQDFARSGARHGALDDGKLFRTVRLRSDYGLH